MFFYMPVKIYQEKNCVLNHASELCSLGKHALIVTGKSSAYKNGSYDDVCAALDSKGVKHDVFDEVEENPSVETVIKGRDKALACSCDFVIGIGGGSPLDAAKAIALMSLHADKSGDYLFTKGADSSALPVVAVPTTCGTGSEATAVSVLTIHSKKTKGSCAHKIFPSLSLVDAKYLLSAPVKVIRNTAVDALAHIWESVINSSATEYSRMPAREGLKTWSHIKDVLLEGRQPDEEEASKLMYASTLAGICIAHTGTSLPHALSYNATYGLGLAHGAAVGYFLAGYLAETEKDLRGEVLDLSGFKTSSGSFLSVHTVL